ncbi:MAG: hypothetical protein WCP12_05060 [bacterium]
MSPLAALHAAEGPLPASQFRIDRQALVTRHNIELNDVGHRLAIGNGEFCFGADGTGLQTFTGNTMSHWAWHSFPLPEGWTKERVPPTGTFQKGRNTGADIFPKDKEGLRTWMFDNPHKINLGRIRLSRSNGVDLAKTDITDLSRTLDLWSGRQTSSYKVDGQAVRVETCVHPAVDMVAVRIESSLLEKGELEVIVDFPGPTSKGKEPWVGDFKTVTGHQTALARKGESRADFKRTLDETSYSVGLEWSKGVSLVERGSHAFSIVSRDVKVLEFCCAFSALPGGESLPSFEVTRAAAAKRWETFWKSGGAIDLSQSKDPRWKELERRIVLSQYQMAAQSAGEWPSAEIGLMALDGWRSQFHMEMVWWHLAHYALWDRWEMADKALGCYKRFTPAARELAQQLGYKGLKWQKSGNTGTDNIETQTGYRNTGTDNIETSLNR